MIMQDVGWIGYKKCLQTKIKNQITFIPIGLSSKITFIVYISLSGYTLNFIGTNLYIAWIGTEYLAVLTL